MVPPPFRRHSFLLFVIWLVHSEDEVKCEDRLFYFRFIKANTIIFECNYKLSLFSPQEEHWKIEPYIPKDDNEDDSNEVITD